MKYNLNSENASYEIYITGRLFFISRKIPNNFLWMEKIALKINVLNHTPSFFEKKKRFSKIHFSTVLSFISQLCSTRLKVFHLLFLKDFIWRFDKEKLITGALEIFCCKHFLFQKYRGLLRNL